MEREPESAAVASFQITKLLRRFSQEGEARTSSRANREAGEVDSSPRDLQPVENVVNRQNMTNFLNYLIALRKNTANLCRFEPSQYDIIDL